MGKGLTRKNKLDVTGFGRDQDEFPQITGEPSTLRRVRNFHSGVPSARAAQCRNRSRPPNTTCRSPSGSRR